MIARLALERVPVAGSPGEPAIDPLGVWSEGGETVWLPRALWPKRIGAIAWAMQEWGVSLPEVRCRARYMRYTPNLWRDGHGRVCKVEDFWTECERAEHGAQAVWRLESA